MVYEMEFYTAKTEYDCEIDATTGKILESSRESLVHETSKTTEANDSDGEDRPAARDDSSAVRNGNDRSDTNPSRKPVNQTRQTDDADDWDDDSDDADDADDWDEDDDADQEDDDEDDD